MPSQATHRQGATGAETTIALLPGDGIGHEVLAGPASLLTSLSKAGERVRPTGPWAVGASAIAQFGTVLPSDTIQACEAADLVLLGAVGDDPSAPGVARPELALLELRNRFELSINVRRVFTGANEALVLVRNLLGGAYVPDFERAEGSIGRAAVDRTIVTDQLVQAVISTALELMDESAPSLISVDKANLLATSRLWRSVVSSQCEALGVTVRHVLVDRCGFELACGKLHAGVIVTEGLFGDILSDVAAGVAGSVALCSSASLTEPQAQVRFGLFEPLHGSAPALAGQNRANPIGAYLALADALEWSGHPASSVAVRRAVTTLRRDGLGTYDTNPGGNALSTAELSELINDRTMSVLAAGIDSTSTSESQGSDTCTKV